jgi:hypothetical protein
MCSRPGNLTKFDPLSLTYGQSEMPMKYTMNPYMDRPFPR